MAVICKRVPSIARNDSDKSRRLVSRLACECWDCKACSIMLKARWRVALMMQLPEISSQWSMHTLTIQIPDAVESRPAKAMYTAALIRRNWDKLAKRLKRELGNFSYVRVLESHKSGAFHAHILISRHIPDDELEPDEKDLKAMAIYGDYRGVWRFGRDNAPECGFGWRYHVVNIKSGETAAVAYAVKYLSKTSVAQKEAMSHYRVRRVQTSRDIKSRIAKKKHEGWRIAPFVVASEIVGQDNGIYFVNESRLLTHEDFVDSNTGDDMFFPPESEIERKQSFRSKNKSQFDII